MALSIISLIGLILAIFPVSQKINFIGAGLIGLGFSGIPPLLISSSGRIFGSGRDLLSVVGPGQPLWSANGVLFDGLLNFMKTAPFVYVQPEQIYICFRQVPIASCV